MSTNPAAIVATPTAPVRMRRPDMVWRRTILAPPPGISTPPKTPRVHQTVCASPRRSGPVPVSYGEGHVANDDQA